jgi:NitT/TauT family transport system substrate-binding protein
MKKESPFEPCRLTRPAFLLAAAAATIRPAAAQDANALHVVCSQVEGQAEAYYADDLGLFKKAGLSVDIQRSRGGSATVTAMLGGAAQIACTNPVSLGQALQRNVPFVILATGALWDAKAPSGYAIVAPNSPVRSPKDLSGQIVGIPSLGGLNQLIMTAFIQNGGGDGASVKFVELPESTTVEALAQGRIAASYMDEPEFSAAGDRIRSIGAASDAIAKSFAETVWFTTSDWLSKNKPAARRAVDALYAAGAWAMANPEAAAGVIERRLGFKEARARVKFATRSDPGQVQVLLDAAAKYKFIPPMHAAAFFWDGK